MAGYAEVAEELVGQHLRQILGAGGVVVRGQAADVDVIGLGQPEQNLSGERALVALQVVEVAGRNAEILGHAGLGEAKFAPQAAEPHAKKQFALRRQGHDDSQS